MEISSIQRQTEAVEIVERKGIGHPDTLCDALAENLSINLSQYYREHFGQILHHNVDKALLCGGQSAPFFGGGEVLEPVDIYLAGRATADVSGKKIPVEEIAIEGSRIWLREHMRYLDVDRHVRLHCKIRPGSADLVSVFTHSTTKVPLANDTSIGVGYAPLSETEQLVLAIDHDRTRHAACGEDTKIMASRHKDRINVTFACAMVGAHLSDLHAYRQTKQLLSTQIASIARDAGHERIEVHVNAADAPQGEHVFLTVTGTSAEAGDDGQVGRGNRVNGLITPYRPMSLEAAAGKNCVNHVGKIYNVVARRVSESIVTLVDSVSAAQCVLLSQIGQPLNQPAIVDIKITTLDDTLESALRDEINSIVANEFEQILALTDEFLDSSIAVY